MYEDIIYFDDYMDACEIFTIFDDEGEVVDIVDTRREAEEYIELHPEWSYR